ncbi:MAG: ABC transporter substrate-binding protein [Pseudomonadota bacterium]
MRVLTSIICITAAGFFAFASPSVAQPAMVETPTLADLGFGDLPAVTDRVPQEPLIVDLAAKGRVPGRHGGTLRTLVTRAKDVRYMAAWGYARLVGYDHDYALVPDLLRDVEKSADGRSVTFHLRRGHRWSDGAPFTTEDFRYWWEDVALNEELSPGGPPIEMLVDGEHPAVEVIDAVTIRYTWTAPNPRFMPALARARPVYIYRPSHYMKTYHAAYAEPAELAEKVEASKKRNWAELHNRQDNLYKFDNPELPILQPWVNTTKKNNQRYVLRRNPYFHRIDSEGRQLPYIDQIELEVAAGGLIPLKATKGDTSLQIRSLGFANAPVLKKKQAEGGYTTRLWWSGAANEIALYPNLTYADPVWREVLQDVRFRRALSLAISRKAINKVIYFGLAKERGVAALEESPFFDEERATAWARFDLDEANALLDDMGLTERNGAGYRLLPDGRPMEVVVETAGERREEEDALGLIAATWDRIGVRLLVKPLDRDILRNRAYAGQSMMVAWWGWNNGVPTPEAPPAELAPVEQSTFSWPIWGQYFQTKGKSGQAPDLPVAQQLLSLFQAWSSAAESAQKAEIWREMLALHADQVICIGTVSRAPQPVVVDERLRNVPANGLYAWDPGAHLGVHRMDEFWYDMGEGGPERASLDAPAGLTEAVR